MKKYKLSIIGDFHINHNEDAIASGEIGNDKIMIAVMDGCSMGTESHFASSLMVKILRKAAKELNYREFAERTQKTISDCLREITKQLFQGLSNLKNQLLLETDELLSTIILGILDKQKKEAALIVVGDGLVCCNGRLFEFDHNNVPDYLGYHLSKNFDTWFDDHQQKLSFKDVTDLSISTDGIFSFKRFDNKEYENIRKSEIIDFLLKDRKWEHQENMLHKKLMEIENKFGLKPGDDLTVLRVIFS